MSQVLTYDILVQQLMSYRERRDQAYVDQIPVFIMLAENRLASELKQQGYQAVVRGKFQVSPVVPKPAFWRETTSFGWLIDDVWQGDLHLRSLEYLRQYWPRQNLLDLPRYYADYDFKHFYVAPTPPVGYDFELIYQARLDPLTKENQENWNCLNVPQVLLAACLVEAARWAKNQGDEQRWEAAYAKAASAVLAENQGRLVDRNTAVVAR